MEAIQIIETDPTYKQIMADSFGGIIYDVANRNKYEADSIKKLWGQLTPAEREAAGGIMKGAFNFLEGAEA